MKRFVIIYWPNFPWILVFQMTHHKIVLDLPLYKIYYTFFEPWFSYEIVYEYNGIEKDLKIKL